MEEGYQNWRILLVAEIRKVSGLLVLVYLVTEIEPGQGMQMRHLQLPGELPVLFEESTWLLPSFGH